MPPKFNIKEIVWTLVDSDESKEGPPNRLTGLGTRHFIIYSTSPQRERWSRLHKVARIKVVVMNPWTAEEIIHVTISLILCHRSTLTSWNSATFPDRKFTNDSINEISDQLSPSRVSQLPAVSRPVGGIQKGCHHGNHGN